MNNLDYYNKASAALGACMSVRETPIEIITRRIKEHERALSDLNKAKDVLEKNPDITEMLEALRNVGF